MLPSGALRVYVSFGCHPKAAWSYSDDYEKVMLACMDSCGGACLKRPVAASGSKVVAFGEFGLETWGNPWEIHN